MVGPFCSVLSINLLKLGRPSLAYRGTLSKSFGKSGAEFMSPLCKLTIAIVYC